MRVDIREQSLAFKRCLKSEIQKIEFQLRLVIISYSKVITESLLFLTTPVTTARAERYFSEVILELLRYKNRYWGCA